MKINVSKQILFLALSFTTLAFFSCVPAKQFEDLQKREKTCQDENTRLKNENQNLQTDNTELKASSSEMQKNIIKLARDTSELGTAYQRQAGLYNELSKSYDKLLANNEKLLAGSTEEIRGLIAQLSKSKEDLQLREDHIKKDSIDLGDREQKLNELRAGLKENQARVAELESILKSADSTVDKLKNSVSKALLGYENNGLSVYQKDGRVYVSMDEQLLFASGSTVIEKNGASALKDLAKVLATDKDINVVVEGHTDNVPISGTLPSGARDNWELSVLRATSVVKIILADNAIEPSRLTAAGRGPYKPIDPAPTAEARKKNRRTEIILTPKLDELVKLLQQIGK
jgi:chemotaxis protein MotB